MYFLANKKMKNNMYEDLKFNIKEYPKGKSKKYNAEYKPSPQKNLFIWYISETLKNVLSSLKNPRKSLKEFMVIELYKLSLYIKK